MADNLAYQAEKLLREQPAVAPEARAQVEHNIQDLRQAMERRDLNDVRRLTETLQQSLNQAMQSAQAAQSAQASPSSDGGSEEPQREQQGSRGDGGDVVEGEFHDA